MGETIGAASPQTRAEGMAFRIIVPMAEIGSGQSVRTTISSNRLIGGKMLRIIRTALCHFISAKGMAAMSIANRPARHPDIGESA